MLPPMCVIGHTVPQEVIEEQEDELPDNLPMSHFALTSEEKETLDLKLQQLY